MLPLCDIVAVYNANTGGFQAAIAGAWGVSAPAALPAGADITASAAAIQAAGIPTRFYYDDADTLITPASVLAMAGVTGGTAVEIPEDLGHAESEINAASLIGGGVWKDMTDHVLAAQAAA